MRNNLYYNFRLGPEALWLIANTVLGTLLVEVAAYFTGLQTLPGWDDFRTWAVALGLSLIRTLLGALLAVVTGGGFQQPKEPAENEPPSAPPSPPAG